MIPPRDIISTTSSLLQTQAWQQKWNDIRLSTAAEISHMPPHTK
jgi:hypothetical protein